MNRLNVLHYRIVCEIILLNSCSMINLSKLTINITKFKIHYIILYLCVRFLKARVKIDNQLKLVIINCLNFREAYFQVAPSS